MCLYEIKFFSLVRLVGSDAQRGRLEIYREGQWGTICDRSFGPSEAIVVCALLGLRYIFKLSL